MKFSMTHKKIAIIIGLFACCTIIVFSLYAPVLTCLQNEKMGIQVIANTTPVIIEGKQDPGNIESCTIMEIDREVAKNSTIIEFSKTLGDIAPELEKGIQEAKGSPEGWYDGRRYANNVIMESDPNRVICSLHNPSADCINLSYLYEYQGRYFQIICITYPQTRPIAGNSSCVLCNNGSRTG